MPQTRTPHLGHTYVVLILSSLLPQPALSAIFCTKDFLSSETPKHVVDSPAIMGSRELLRKWSYSERYVRTAVFLWKNLMTTAGLKNSLLINQTVHGLAYLHIWRQRKTCWHYLPFPLMARLSSLSYSTKNLQSIAFFTKSLCCRNRGIWIPSFIFKFYFFGRLV